MVQATRSVVALLGYLSLALSTVHGFSSSPVCFASRPAAVSLRDATVLQETSNDVVVASATATSMNAELVQRSLLQARLDMEQKQRQVLGQAAEIESNFDDDSSDGKDATELMQRSLLQAQLMQSQMARQRREFLKTQELAAIQKEDRESKQGEASTMARRTRMQQEAALSKAAREQKQDEASTMVRRARMQTDAASSKAAREQKQMEANVMVRQARMQTEAAASQAAREQKQMEANAMVSNVRREQTAATTKKERESKQQQALTMVHNAKRTEVAIEAKESRESKQEQAFAMIRSAQREAEAAATHHDREFKQAEADRLLQKSLGDQPRYVMLSRQELDQLSEKYAAIDDLSERAYQILKDLGSFDWVI